MFIGFKALIKILPRGVGSLVEPFDVLDFVLSGSLLHPGGSKQIQSFDRHPYFEVGNFFFS